MKKKDEEMMENREKGGLFATPQLPAWIYQNLPGILGESTELFQEAIEKDVFLIGALAVLSGCLPNIRGIYFDEPCSAHLYAFITAPAGSGKGKMKWARYFGQTIHDHLVEKSRNDIAEYAQEMEKYNELPAKERANEDKPSEPQHRMFFIPANSSSSAFIQALADNNFTGVPIPLPIPSNKSGGISAMCSGKHIIMRVPAFSAVKIRSLLISKILTWPSHYRELPVKSRI